MACLASTIQGFERAETQVEMQKHKAKKWGGWRTRAEIIVVVVSSNCLAILVTLFQGLDLENIARVYWFQLFISYILTLVQILSAEYADPPRRGTAQSFVFQKYYFFGIFLLLNGVFLTGHFFLFYNFLSTDEPLTANLIYVLKCSPLFLGYSFYCFRQERENGLHRKLIDEGELLRFWCRIQVVLIPCLTFLGAKKDKGIDYSDAQFVLVVALIAIADSTTQIIRMERNAELANSRQTVD